MKGVNFASCAFTTRIADLGISRFNSSYIAEYSHAAGQPVYGAVVVSESIHAAGEL